MDTVVDTAGCRDEVFEFAKLMAEQEVLDNKKKKYKSTFWASTVNILSQKLNIVQVRRDGGY